MGIEDILEGDFVCEPCWRDLIVDMIPVEQVFFCLLENESSSPHLS